MQPKFKVGDVVKILDGKLNVVSMYRPGVTTEYDFKGYSGKIEEVVNYVIGYGYHVSVKAEGSEHVLILDESKLESMPRISTSFSNLITKSREYQRALDSLDEVSKKIVRKAMSKEKCIELLERYRAERDKLAKGRRFELRLRDNVVNEALERAIELLKGGQS